jgi:hypothetical protein
VLLTTFLLRLWGVKQGLPYSYNTDEATHFVPRAVGFFGHDFNPHPVKLGSGGSGGGPGYLPVDVHLGARLGAHARRRARRRHPASGAPPRGHGARAAPLAGRVHRLHGRPAAVLRPLADADLPDHRRAGRYGAVELVRRLARIRRVPPLLAGVAVGVLLLAQPEAAPGAIAYYAALARRGTLVFRTTPFAPAARAVPFNFDRSIDYYPGAYRRPGPEMSIYRLSGGSCGTKVSSG